MGTKHFGILASIDWNSNKWQNLPTTEDLQKANFGNVQKFEKTMTFLDFGHDMYPTNEEGYYEGHAPHIHNGMPLEEKKRHVEIVFLKSLNWHDKQNYIVGFYAFPIIEKSKKPSPISEFKEDIDTCIKALPENIHLLGNYAKLTSNPDLKKFLPKDKKLGSQGFNYLTKENVFKILDEMTKLNPDDKKLSGIKYKLITSIERKDHFPLKK